MALWIPPRYRRRTNAEVLIPGQFFDDKGTMYDAFLFCAHQRGDSDAHAIELLKLLPKPIKSAIVMHDRITDIWRYKYGSPYDRLPDETLVSGTNEFMPVIDLYRALHVADRRLTKVQLIKFIERLKDNSKHLDVVFEMRPLLNVDDGFQAYYEVIGYGPGNTTLDWWVEGRYINIVFDVKNRTKSLINHLRQIIPQLNLGEDYAQPSSPNPSDLFLNVQEKLKEMCFLCQLQGVWIHTDIKEDEVKLREYFDNHLNNKKVHFAVISDWLDDAYILACNHLISNVIGKTFKIIKSKRFVARDY